MRLTRRERKFLLSTWGLPFPPESRERLLRLLFSWYSHWDDRKNKWVLHIPTQSEFNRSLYNESLNNYPRFL